MESNPVAVACDDVVNFLLRSGVGYHEAMHMRELNVQNEHRELLELAERYGNCMAFLDHMELTNRLSAAWNAVCDKLSHEKKQVVRKLRVMEADKNADPDAVENYKAKRDKLQKDLAVINLTCIRMAKLKEIPVDYDMQFPDEMLLPNAALALLPDEVQDETNNNDDNAGDGNNGDGDAGGEDEDERPQRQESGSSNNNTSTTGDDSKLAQTAEQTEAAPNMNQELE